MEIPTTPDAETKVLSYHRRSLGGDVEARLTAQASLRHLGMVCVLLGFGFIGLSMIFTSWWSWKSLDDPQLLLIMAPFATFGISGIVYWICGVKLLRGNATAAFVALILAAMHLCTFLFFAVASGIVLFNGGYMATVSLVISALFMLGLGELIRNLLRYLQATKYTH